MANRRPIPTTISLGSEIPDCLKVFCVRHWVPLGSGDRQQAFLAEVRAVLVLCGATTG